MRRLLQCGTALPLALLAMPAQAACTVEGDTTTCTGDISGGIGTSTPNVVVTDLTTDAGAPAGFSAIWLPDVATAQIDTGDHALNVQGAAAIAAVSGNPIDMDFTGTINVSGLDPAGNSGAGIIANANGDGGWDASVRSTGDITVDVTRDANSSQNGNRGILANGGTAGTATIESTGNVSVTVSGMSTFAMGLQAAAGAGASITNTGDVSVIAAGGFGSAIGATSVADTVVSSVGNVSADFGPGVGYGISAGGLRNTIHSQGDVTADEGGIVAQGHLLYDDEGALLPYFAIAESSEIISTGNVSTSGNGAPAILALGDEVTVNSTGAITTTGDVSAGIGALRNFTYDRELDQGTFDAGATSVSVTNNGDITTSGEESYGIAAGATLGTASVTTVGDISTAGDWSHGIVATGQQVAIDFDGTISTEGLEANGVLVADFAMIDGEAEIVGPMVGDATITGGNVATTGDGSAGIYALVDGDLTIDAGSVSTSGIGAMGVRATSVNGDTSLTLESVSTTGQDDGLGSFSEGVFAESVNGSASVVVGSASAEGFAASGVVALGGAGASISADEAGVTGQHSAALYASSSHGAATVNAGSVTLRGDQQAGINAFAYGGAATVTVDGIVGEGTSGNGIYAEATGGVSVASGSIDVEHNGARAVGLGGSNATIETTGNTVAETGYALFGEGADVSITTAADTLTQGATYGIRAIASGSATILNSGTAAATGDLGSAIHVAAPGAVSITSDAVTVAGAGAFPGVRDDGSGYRIEQGGIIVEGGEGPISIAAGSVDVAGEHRYGISARGSGTIGIAADGVTLASADSVAVVARGGAGDVTLTTGTVTTIGASGVGVFADSTTGNIVIDAGTTRVENEGMAGAFTGDAVVATSVSGIVSIASADAFTAALYGSAVVGISGGDVSVVSGKAEATGDEGVTVYAQSHGGNASVESDSVVATGANLRAIRVSAANGVASLQVGDVTALGEGAYGVLVTGREAQVVVDGTVQSTQGAVVAQSPLGPTNVLVNGSVVSTEGTAVTSLARDGLVEIAEGASVEGATAGVSLVGGPEGGFTQFYNSGTVTGVAGPAMLGSLVDPATVPADFYIQNNGTLVGEGGVAVLTGAGADTLELTNLSQITGIADLGAGDDRLVLDLNDDAPEGAIGQVASTINVEGLSVDSGSWRAEGVQSVYDFVEIEEGATLTVVENAEGSLAVEAASVGLNGALRLDLSVDETEGDLGETAITGSGSLHLVGTATVELTDATGLQHTGGTFVEDGELLLTTVYGGDIATSGDGVFELGEGGDFTGNLVNDGTFVFSRADDYDFLGDFSGSGLLTKQGDGTLTFAGLYSFTGTTSVLGGSVAFTGQLSEDTELDLAEGTVDLSQVEGGEQTIAQLSGAGGTLQLGETALVIEQIADTVFSGTITGMGELIKDGEGDLKLNGDGTGFTGTGEVNGGTLSVNGSFENATFEVNSGGTLGGSGTVGDTMILGGTLAAGNSIGTLTVAGDLAFTAGSTLEVEVDPAGNADLIQVTGTATLGGATVDVLAESGTYRPLTDYTILTAAGGISGTFGAVDVNLAFLDPSLTYSANAVSLRLVRNDIDFASFAGTPNQSAIANLIESFGYGNTLYNETLTLVDSDVAPSFASLTGDVYPAYASATIETAEMLRRQTAGKAGGEGAYAWTTGLYNQVSSGNSAGEIELGGTGVAGGFGFGSNDFSVSAGIGILDQGRGGGQFSDGEVTFAVGRVAYDSAAGLTASAGAQFGWVDGNTRRQTSLGAIDQAVTGAIEGDYLQLFGELGYRIAMGEVAIEPFAGVSHVSLEFDGLTETGAATALAVSGIDRDVTFAQAGLRLSGDVSGLRPFASASYRRAWGDRASLASVGFAGVTGTALISADPIAEDAVELDAGLATATGPLELEVGYRGTISKGFDSHGLSAGLKFRF